MYYVLIKNAEMCVGDVFVMIHEYIYLGCVLCNQKLAAGLEQHIASQRKRQLSQEKHNEECCNTVSSRVREIAKSTLHFSDLDVDQFFSGRHEEQQVIKALSYSFLSVSVLHSSPQQVNCQVCQLSESVESKLSEVYKVS